MAPPIAPPPAALSSRRWHRLWFPASGSRALWGIQDLEQRLPGPRGRGLALQAHGGAKAGQARCRYSFWYTARPFPRAPSFDLTVRGRGEYSLMNTFAQYGLDGWTMDHENYGRSDGRHGALVLGVNRQRLWHVMKSFLTKRI